MKYIIDINADVGEGLENEDQLLPYLSSCNIACGGHAGDQRTMHKVVRLANTHNVKIGAHPSFPDKKNFGREIMNINADDLFSIVKNQINDLQRVLNIENAQLHHIKPHGALYNLAAKDRKTAKVIIEVLKSISLPVELYAPPKSIIAKLAKKENIDIVFEAFADRNYNIDLSLVSRKENHAIISKKEHVLDHVLNMVKFQKVNTISGVEVELKASTFCVHGDTENAFKILKYLNQKLPEHHIKIR